MKAMKWLFAAAGLALVSACAYDPAYDNYYGANYGYYDRYAYAPDYVAPSVTLGFSSDRRHYWDGRRWHHWDGHRWVG